MFQNPLRQHALRHKPLQRGGDGVQYALPDVVIFDVERDAAFRMEVTLNLPHVLPLRVREKRQVHFRDDGETSVFVHDAYERVDAPRLVDVVSFAACFAETERTVA